MSEINPKVIYIRAGNSGNDRSDLAGLIGRIMREAITSNTQYFVLQIAYDQEVLKSVQAWKTLKQVTLKQGMSMVVSGGSDEVREMAMASGFPIVGTAESHETSPADLERIRAQVLGFALPEELGGLNFEQVAVEYRKYEMDGSLRTTGGFIEFVRQRYKK